MAGPSRSSFVESVGSQWRDPFADLEQGRDRAEAYTHSYRAPSARTGCTDQHRASHHSHEDEVHSLRREVDCLRRRLHCKAQVKEEMTPTPSQSSSSDDGQSYRQRSRTSPSESFTSLSHSTLGERYRHKKNRTPPRRTLGNDAMGKALLQISHSPFTRCIEQA